MERDPERDDYALIGYPVSRSLSPAIHASFAEQVGHKLRYLAIDVRDRFEPAVREFFAAGGRGLNVTVPHKGSAYNLANEVSMGARVARAVNTLSLGPDCTLVGDNTDGPGLIHDMTDNLGIALVNRSVLLVGAGGAARGVIAPLFGAGIASLTVANRTASRAEHLATDFTGFGDVRGTGLDNPGEAPFDVVINATSAGLSGDRPSLPASVVQGAVCYDMVYTPDPTVFCQWAADNGADACHGGIGMLVEQAAESFRIWRGIRPDTGPVIEHMRQILAAT